MKYVVDAHMEDGSWLATVPSLEGAHTFAKSFSKLDASVREMIALIEDLPDGTEETLDLEWSIHDAPDNVLHAVKIAEDRLSAQRAIREVERSTAEAVRLLTRDGFSQRDQALFLGITAGRVGQLSSM